MNFVIPNFSKRYPNDFEKIIETNWQETVTETDTVIHLGDISFNEKCIERFGSWNSKKILVRGNHDKKPYDF